MMNWQKVSLTNTRFMNIGKNSKGKYTSYNRDRKIRAILVRGGVSEINIKDCTFQNLPKSYAVYAMEEPEYGNAISNDI